MCVCVSCVCVCVQAVASGGREGNVHSGAIPPWMKDEEDDEEEKGERAPIGPSFDAFLKHSEF